MPELSRDCFCSVESVEIYQARAEQMRAIFVRRERRNLPEDGSDVQTIHITCRNDGN